MLAGPLLMMTRAVIAYSLDVEQMVWTMGHCSKGIGKAMAPISVARKEEEEIWIGTGPWVQVSVVLARRIASWFGARVVVKLMVEMQLVAGVVIDCPKTQT